MQASAYLFLIFYGDFMTTVSRTNYSKFLKNFELFMDTVDVYEIKQAIGDSINNNRALTVNQVVRYLTSRRNKDKKLLGEQLQVVYDATRFRVILNRRTNGLRRNDAIDVGEFVRAVNTERHNPFAKRSA